MILYFCGSDNSCIRGKHVSYLRHNEQVELMEAQCLTNTHHNNVTQGGCVGGRRLCGYVVGWYVDMLVCKELLWYVIVFLGGVTVKGQQ